MAFIGGMMAHTPFAYLNELFGWRQALLIDGAVGAFLFLWIYFIVQDKPADAPDFERSAQQKILPSFINALANPQNWLAGLYTSLLNLPIMVLCALWGASYLQVVHHISDIGASNIISLIFMGSIIGCPLVGWLSDSQGRRKPLMIIGALATLITVTPLFMPIALSQMALSIIFFALGFFTSTQVISYPLIAESNNVENTGSSTGIASVIIMGGGGVGQVLFGWLMTYHAHNATRYAVDDFQFALWIFPIAAFAALIAVLMTRETYCKR
jgi:sugar phosphate permease